MRLDWRYVLLVTIRRCSGFKRQPPAINRLANQSSKLGMARPVAIDAKIVGRGDDAAAKMTLPDAIDDHAAP